MSFFDTEIDIYVLYIDLDWVYYIYNYISGQFITTSAEVTPNGGLVRESPPKWIDIDILYIYYIHVSLRISSRLLVS